MNQRDRTILFAVGKPPNASIRMAPCAFCAGPPVLDHNYTPEKFVAGDRLFDAWVWCHECGARGPRADGLVDEPAELWDVMSLAVDLWNNRDVRHRDLYEANRRNNTYPDPGGRHTPREPA